MKIATWNVNSIRARLEHVHAFLLNENIDVLLLQEIKCTNELFPSSIFNNIGYNCIINGQKSYNGVAILTKYKAQDILLGDNLFTIKEARYVEAFINGLRIASVYVPNGREINTDYYFSKLYFLDELINHIKEISKNEYFIIGGDFNIARSDLDVWNPDLWHNRNCCSTKERDKIDAILNLGLRDSQRDIASTDKIFTWWDYRSSGYSKNNGLRLDYIFTSNNISVKSWYRGLYYRKMPRPSDHCPVIIEIVI